jgi:hypothetical protein
VGMAQASTEHVSRAGVSKVENLEQQAMARRPAVLKLKWPACMSRGRSAASRSRWRGALSRHIMFPFEPVGVTAHMSAVSGLSARGPPSRV